ncbi:1,2-phenylacetyl-CoA epoxidase subunit PaaE [Burkholderiaceae bacterium UC74_6]
MSLHFHPLRVNEVHLDAEDALVIGFEVPVELRETFRFTAGQYLTLRADVNGQDLRRSYSICAGEGDGVLRVGVRRVEGGAFSSFVHGGLKPGDVIEVFPPQGRFSLPQAKGPRHVLGIAGGSGITPILSIMKTLLEREPQSRFTLLYANRRQASAMFKEEIEDLKNQHMGRLSLFHVFSREMVDAPLFAGRLDAGKLAQIFATAVQLKNVDEAFVCGPFEMNEHAEAVLSALGMKASQIHIERFGTPEMQQGRAAPHEVKDGDAQAIVTLIRDGLARDFEFSREDPSLLDAAARAGIEVPYSCKSGVCSTCRCKLVEGQVRMDKNFALDKAEVAAGFILSCQAHALTPKIVISFDER